MNIMRKLEVDNMGESYIKIILLMNTITAILYMIALSLSFNSIGFYIFTIIGIIAEICTVICAFTYKKNQ